MAKSICRDQTQETALHESVRSVRELSCILEYLLTSLYAHDEEPLLACMTDNCSVITLQGETLKGKEAFRRVLDEIKLMPEMRLSEISFHVMGLPYQDAGYALVAGSYQLYSAAKEELLFSAGRQVTACFCWNTAKTGSETDAARLSAKVSLSDEASLSNETSFGDKTSATSINAKANSAETAGWCIYHLHFSNVDTQLVNGDLFPIETSRETYDYVRRILHAGRRSGMLPSRVVIKEGMQLHYLDPNDILCIEAQGKHCLVVQVEKQTLILNELLSEVEAQLPGAFIRIHRSYVVNSAHIQSVERYSLVLTDGTRIPIPKQRFTQIKREIALRVSEV